MSTGLLALMLAAPPSGSNTPVGDSLYQTVDEAIRVLEAGQDERFLREFVEQEWLVYVLRNVSLEDWRDGDSVSKRSYLHVLKQARTSGKRAGEEGKWAALLVEATHNGSVVWLNFVRREDGWYISVPSAVNILWSIAV